MEVVTAAAAVVLEAALERPATLVAATVTCHVSCTASNRE